MAGRITREEVKIRYSAVLNEIYDGEIYYRFYQKHYFEDFLRFFASSATKTYEKIANLIGCDSEGKDHGRTISRYHDIILFGEEIKTYYKARKIVDVLFALQDNSDFNPKHHIYIDEIGRHRDAKFVYQWDSKLEKWKDIVSFDNVKRNEIIGGYIYELLGIMSESDFYCLKAVEQNNTKNCDYDTRIKEIYTMIDELYIANLEMNEKWIGIMNPIKNMICKHEFPGVCDPAWIQANEAITYFDVAYDIADSIPEVFELIKNGKTGIKFSIDIDSSMIYRRKQYLLEKKREDEFGNAHRSDVQLLEEEMKIALKRLVKKLETL